MSVTTTADEELVEVRKEIESSVKRLSKIVIDRCWGWEDFTHQYQVKLRARLNTLLDLRDEFGG